MTASIPRVLKRVFRDYALPPDGAHGVIHWGRVYENGMRLAEKTGADVRVVQLFAVLHDSRRLNEWSDPEHGPRAADYAVELRDDYLDDLGDAAFQLLYEACHGHTHQRTHPDVTVQTCWDADRLDLGRVGITPAPHRLCTPAAKASEIFDWANHRATCDLVPEVLSRDWGIDPWWDGVQYDPDFGEQYDAE